MWLKDKLFALKLRGILNSQNSTKEKNVNNKAQSIAILFDESQISSPAEVQQYVNRWNSKGKKVETFRYVDVKEFTEDNQSDDKFCRKDLNWYGLPNSEKINSFVSYKTVLFQI